MKINKRLLSNYINQHGTRKAAERMVTEIIQTFINQRNIAPYLPRTIVDDIINNISEYPPISETINDINYLLINGDVDYNLTDIYILLQGIKETDIQAALTN